MAQHKLPIQSEDCANILLTRGWGLNVNDIIMLADKLSETDRDYVVSTLTARNLLMTALHEQKRLMALNETTGELEKLLKPVADVTVLLDAVKTLRSIE